MLTASAVDPTSPTGPPTEHVGAGRRRLCDPLDLVYYRKRPQQAATDDRRRIGRYSRCGHRAPPLSPLVLNPAIHEFDGCIPGVHTMAATKRITENRPVTFQA
ncbi:hypothetical protein BU14_0384s0005 [Porphyra umbilicalis]|uniref:Uncharacterized protein n=1 Tax=Porphyra umbilicalis TaxID=2786 RepID=A0A1X6NWP3_PORUM|nr:hypothetical protein BU14_0384s0005 [Porphyra umbilicalis]|eukprot:OSX73018.1 hypothetical protein BU14_0384s0005 [Porphyra umbilicalis]